MLRGDGRAGISFQRRLLEAAMIIIWRSGNSAQAWATKMYRRISSTRNDDQFNMPFYPAFVLSLSIAVTETELSNYCGATREFAMS